VRTLRDIFEDIQKNAPVPVLHCFDPLMDAIVIEPPASGGPCYVVTREAMDALARAMVAVASGLDEVGEDWDETMQGMWEESYAQAVARFRRRIPAILRALYGKDGGVYEAEAVRCVQPTTDTFPVLIDGGAIEFKPGDLVAVGLKEVGRG